MAVRPETRRARKPGPAPAPRRKDRSSGRAPADPAGLASAWIDLLQEPMAIVDPAGTLRGCNAAFRGLLNDPGSGRTPAVGDAASDWLEADPPLSSPPRGSLATPEHRRARTRCGEMEARLVTLPPPLGEGWLVGLRRQQQSAAGGHLALLQEVAQELGYALEPFEVFRRLLDLIGQAFGFEVAVCAWSRGEATSGLLRLEVPVDPGVVERELEKVARDLGHPWSRRPGLIIERGLRYRPQEQALTSPPPHRLIAPLHRAGAPAGMLFVASSSPALGKEENRRLLQGIANQVSLTLERLDATRAVETGKFQAVIDSMPVGVLLLDSLGRVRLSNPAARALLARLGEPEAGPLLRLGGLDLLPLLADVARGRSAESGREGEQAGRILRLSLSPVRGAAFEEPTVLLVVEDVTEQRRVQEQLMQSEKLSSLGEMISGVAHELNNPLATVLGYAQLLLEAETSADARRMLQVVDSESQRCQRIVRTLLTFARRQPPERGSLEMATLLRAAVDLASYGMKAEGVQVGLEVEDGLPAVLGDAHQLQQVFLNILQNACQAMEDVPAPRRITVRAKRDGASLRVEFSDTGPGIAAGHLSKIFDPFFTTKTVGRGTGLGLSLAYGVVQEHGGTIEARNNSEGGACITVGLPAAPASAPQPAGQAQPAAPGADEVTGRRILVVDDEELLATVMREALEVEGYKVEVALDGAAALDRLRQTRYDLVITDVKMPNMNGRELHREILRSTPALAGRILFSTGDVVNPATRKFFAETRSPHITKPFNLTELRRMVRSLLRSPGADA